MHVPQIKTTQPYEDPRRWDRLMYYADHVRAITFSANTIPKHVDVDVLRLLFQHNGGRSIFPSLQSLYWRHTSRTTGDTLVQLLTPSMHTLTLDYYHDVVDDAVLGPLASALQVRSPHLEVFRIIAQPPPSLHVFTQLVQDLGSLKTLREVTFSNMSISPSLFKALATHPSLSCIGGLTIDSFAELADWGDPVQFPYLRTLVVAGRCDTIAPTFETLRMPTLSNLAVTINDTGPSAACVRCMAALRTAVAPQHITTLSVRFHSDLSRLRDTPVPLLRLLRPLLSLREMVELSFQCRSLPFTATDEEFISIAQAWPKLEKLCVDTIWQWQPGPGVPVVPSAAVLVHFRHSCPALRSLDLPYMSFGISTSALPTLSELVRLSPGTRSQIATLHINSHAQVIVRHCVSTEWQSTWAEYLLGLFPELDINDPVARRGSDASLFDEEWVGWKNIFECIARLTPEERQEATGRDIMDILRSLTSAPVQ